MCRFAFFEIFINMKRNEQIIKMYTSGSSVTMIAEILNVGYKTVYRVTKQFDINVSLILGWFRNLDSFVFGSIA